MSEDCSAEEIEATLTVVAQCHCLSGGDPATCPLHKDRRSIFDPVCTCGVDHES